MKPRDEIEYGTYKSYTLGFLVCVALTFASYFVAKVPLATGQILFYSLLALGFIQVVVQLVLFLHVGEEEKPRHNLVVFLFMLLVLVVIVVGSFWIMANLKYNVMDM